MSEDNSKLKEKIDKNKEKLKQLDNKKDIFQANIKDAEAKLKKSLSENITLKESFKKEIDNLNSVINELKETIAVKDGLIDDAKEKQVVLEIKVKELKERNDYLEVICKSSKISEANNNVLEGFGIDESFLHTNQSKKNESQLNLNNISLNNNENNKRMSINQDLKNKKTLNK